MVKKLVLCVLAALAIVLLPSCSPGPTPTAGVPTTQAKAPTVTPVPATATATSVVAVPTTAPTETPVPATATSIAATQTKAPAAATAEPTATAPKAAPTAGASFAYPPPPTGIPAVLPSAQPLGKLVAFAWNNLGMHCAQKDYSMFLILPPYNVFWTQAVARGEDPRILSGGATVSYSVPQVTNPVPHTNFWDYAAAYGWQLQPGIGLKGKGTSGSMDAAGDHWIADGVPVVDVNDDGTWDPYPFFVVTVKDSTGKVAAETVNVAPVSTEMSCYLCHVADTIPDSMAVILQAHDGKQGTNLLSQAKSGRPAMCSSCHADPAMGVTESKGSPLSLSAAVHTFHADKMTGAQVPENVCQACHPGPQTQCLRDVMAKAGVTCIDCHGGMADVGAAARTSWVNLPRCESCHTAALGRATTRRIDNPNQYLTADDASLYRNSKAHGGGGIYCAACHGSPHAIYPTLTARDNEQSIRLQGRAGPIIQCIVCHMEQPEERFFHQRTRD